ncbi:MAG TPA: hypothetical protein VE074_17515 [Jatrophihabitantaceae bacterium]|nr:hypothetical protein [Jatrophihabitantaceae bacterium]
MQFRRASQGLIGGAVLVLGLGLGATALAASPPPAIGNGTVAPLSTSIHGTGGGGALTQVPSGPAAGLAPMGKVTRPEVRPAGSPNATYRQVLDTWGPLAVGAGGGAWLEAYCPSGMLATGGGEVNGSVAGGVTLRNTYALGGGSGWHVDITNDSASSTSVTVYAVCFSGLTTYQQITASASPSNGSAYVSIPCSGGQIVGGGGWSGSNSAYPTEAIASLYYHDWLWNVHSTSSSAVVTAQAICADGIGNLQSPDGTHVSVAPGQSVGAHTACPSGTLVVSGGGEAYLRVTDSFFSGQAWYWYVHNDFSTTVDTDAQAICGT